MSRRRNLLVAVAVLATATGAIAQQPATSLSVPRADGWYSWSVAASATGSRTCCYDWHGGRTAKQRVCDLDGERGGYTINGDCLLDSDEVRVYVRMQGGRPSRIRALNSDCPVSTASEVTDLGAVPADNSVRWLSAQISDDRHGNAEILAAIPMHAGDAAFEALTTLLEDRRRSMDLREQALFWLVQSGSDDAFAYVDLLLSQRLR